MLILVLLLGEMLGMLIRILISAYNSIYKTGQSKAMIVYLQDFKYLKRLKLLVIGFYFYTLYLSIYVCMFIQPSEMT